MLQQGRAVSSLGDGVGESTGLRLEFFSLPVESRERRSGCMLSDLFQALMQLLTEPTEGIGKHFRLQQSLLQGAD